VAVHSVKKPNVQLLQKPAAWGATRTVMYKLLKLS